MAGLPPPLPPAAPLSSFRDYYNDVTRDEYNRDYALLMQSFAVPNGQNPANLRDLATNNAENSSVGYAHLCLDPHNPAGPGVIRVTHNLTRYRAALGQPATVWDGRMFGSTGDTVGTQIPATVELPGTLFQQLNNGATYRVGIGQMMNIMYAQPNLQVLGPYGNHDAGTELIQCRNSAPVPHRYMGYFVTGPKTPRQAWEVVGHDISVNGDEDNCRILFDFLRLACTVSAAGDPASPLAQLDLVAPVPDAALITHRTNIINLKLPGLNRVPTLQAGTEIVAALGGLVEEQRATRQEALQRRLTDSVKTVDDYYGASVIHLLRMCQVPDSGSLPDVYQALAQAGKKKARLTMQLALDESAELLGYGSLRVLLTPDVCSKIDQLLWRSHHSDLSVGVNPCTFGDIDPDSVQASSDLIRQYDLLNSGVASPSLQDLQSLIGKSKVALARNFVDLEAALKMFHIYLHTFYGPAHVITENWREFVSRSSNEYRTLQYYQAKTPRHHLLVPAMVQHWCKMKYAYFVDIQWSSNAPVAVPDFGALWEKIQTGEQWEIPLPAHYLQPLPLLDLPPSVPNGPYLSPGTAGRRPPTGGLPTPATTTAASVVNLNYNGRKFQVFKDLGLMVKEVMARAVAAGHAIPKNDRGEDMCITYHVKGFCNMNCRRKGDHSPPGPARSPAEEAKLFAWCETCYVAAT
jgi:hypothetical protein